MGEKVKLPVALLSVRRLRLTESLGHKVRRSDRKKEGVWIEVGDIASSQHRCCVERTA